MLFSPSCREFNSLQKRYAALLIEPILFSENKIVVDEKVDGYILFGARGKKRKIYLVLNDSYENIYLAVKGI